MDKKEQALQKHFEWKGKIQIQSRVPVSNSEELSLAYTPGVAQPCIAISKDKSLSFELTRRHNLVAVVTDGTAVLGLGDIGPEASMPVMEGKCALLREFGQVDAFPLCIRSKDVDEIVRTVYLISSSFGGINLEDISAPRCFEIEKKLKELCDIPVFHDDQHGTAIVVGAALLNALKVTNKHISQIRCVISGAGAAGIAIGKHLLRMGVKNLILCDRFGILTKDMKNLNPAHKEMSLCTNPENLQGTLEDALIGSHVFIGVSAPHIVSKEMIYTMAKESIVFPMANPVPEIDPALAKEGGALIVGTGRSDYPNQINNVLAFPGIFRGALDVRARDINDQMKLAASHAIASLVSHKELSKDYILPKAFDKRVGPAVAKAVAKAARDSHVAKL